MLFLNLLIGFVFKPLVLLITLLVLKQLKNEQGRVGMDTLYKASLLFFIGEVFCAFDVYFTQRMTFVNEGLHDVFMLLSFAFYYKGLFDLLIEKHSCFRLDCEYFKNCEIDYLGCNKNTRGGKLFIFSLFLLVILSILPLFAQKLIFTISMDYGLGGNIFGQYVYHRTEALYFLQQLIFPGIAIFCFSTVILAHALGKRLTQFTYYLIFFGMGALSFVYFRLILILFYYPVVVYTAIGEEILELGLVIFLYIWLKSKKR